MKSKVFLPTVLAVAIGAILVGCGGGGSSSPNIVSTPPTNGGIDPKPPEGGGTDPKPPEGGGTDPKPPEGGGTDPKPPEGGVDPKPSFVYDRNNYTVAEPDTSQNKVNVGVMDTGVRMNDYLSHSVQKVFNYIEDYWSGKITIDDLTNAGIEVQDLGNTFHGTKVSEVIAGKNPAGSGGKDGLAVDIAQIYGVRTSNTSSLGLTTANFQAMIDLNEKYGVKLFNASFGSAPFTDEIYKGKITQYALKLVNGGSLVIFAAGNKGDSFPDAENLLPVGHSEMEKGFLTVTGLNKAGDALYKGSRDAANACGDAARWCLATSYTFGPIYSDKINDLVTFTGTSASAPQVTATAAMVWSKYPWMTADQVRQVILTSSDYMDDGSGKDVLFNKTFGWGALNIKDALKGPELFSRIFSDNFDANLGNNLAIFSNNIGGDAGLVKSGHGTLVMAGESTYTGSTTIDQGKLQVTGSITSDVLVNANGTLSGRGTVGSVSNNGLVATNDGRLTIKGDFLQSAKATFGYSLHHFLKVNGKAQLDGALEVSAKDKKMVTEGTHDVLYAEQVSGTFSSYKSTSPFLKVNGLTTGSDKVSIEVGFADAAKAGTVSGGISTASGELLNKLMAKANTDALAGENNGLTDYIAKVQQSSNQVAAQAVLNSNAGALFVETPSVLLRNDTLINAQISQRTHQVTKQGLTGVWATGSYLESTNQASGWDTVDSDIRVVSAGADTKLFENIMLGGYLSQYDEKSKYSASNGTSETKLTELGVYGKWKSETPFYVAANAKYGFGDTKFDRTVTNGVDFESSKAKSDVDKYAVYGEVGYDFMQSPFALSPYVALSHNRISLDAVNESSAYGVSVGDIDANESKAHLGLRFDYALSKNLAVAGYTEYAYAFDRSLPYVDLSSNVANSVTVGYKAPSFDKDYFLYGIGFNYLTPSMKWNVFGDIAGNAINSGDYQLQLGLKYVF